jgi:hypothetical protein
MGSEAVRPEKASPPIVPRGREAVRPLEGSTLLAEAERLPLSTPTEGRAIQRMAAEGSAAPSVPLPSMPAASTLAAPSPAAPSVGAQGATAPLAPSLGPAEAAVSAPAATREERGTPRIAATAFDEPAGEPALARSAEGLALSDRPAAEGDEEPRTLRSPAPQDEAPTESLGPKPVRRKGFDLERAARPEGGEERSARQATVRISIGRVEVRVAETAKPAKPSPRRPSVPSLADYLEGRRGRR